MVVKTVNEYMRELLNVQTLTPGSLPVYPLLTCITTLSWNLTIFQPMRVLTWCLNTYCIITSSTSSLQRAGLNTLYLAVRLQICRV